MERPFLTNKTPGKRGISRGSSCKRSSRFFNDLDRAAGPGAAAPEVQAGTVMAAPGRRRLSRGSCLCRRGRLRPLGEADQGFLLPVVSAFGTGPAARHSPFSKRCVCPLVPLRELGTSRPSGPSPLRLRPRARVAHECRAGRQTRATFPS